MQPPHLCRLFRHYRFILFIVLAFYVILFFILEVNSQVSIYAVNKSINKNAEEENCLTLEVEENCTTTDFSEEEVLSPVCTETEVVVTQEDTYVLEETTSVPQEDSCDYSEETTAEIVEEASPQCDYEIPVATYENLYGIPDYTYDIIINYMDVDSSMVMDFYNRICEISLKIAYKECRAEPYEGQVAVFATFLNRLKSDEHPDTPEEVAQSYASYQDVSLDEIKKYYPSLESALQDALVGYDPTKEYLNGLGALYFYNPDLCSYNMLEERASISVTHRIGQHVFYAIWD